MGSVFALCCSYVQLSLAEILPHKDLKLENASPEGFLMRATFRNEEQQLNNATDGAVNMQCIVSFVVNQRKRGTHH
jgi:hypothetical protein